MPATGRVINALLANSESSLDPAIRPESQRALFRLPVYLVACTNHFGAHTLGVNAWFRWLRSQCCCCGHVLGTLRLALLSLVNPPGSAYYTAQSFSSRSPIERQVCRNRRIWHAFGAPLKVPVKGLLKASIS